MLSHQLMPSYWRRQYWKMNDVEEEIGKKKLSMSFDPNTIDHLGVKMYSRIPIAIAELIANSYDAGANEVYVVLEDGEDKKIIVSDDGSGMTFDEVNDNFLKIGRNLREEGDIKSPNGARKVTGRKGLGKLSLFGIGNNIEIETIKDGNKVVFEMDWEKLKQEHERAYEPELIFNKSGKFKDGTKISLSNLKRKSDFNLEDLAISISKLFNFFDEKFRVFIKKDDEIIEINNELKYDNIDEEFLFEFPNYISDKEIVYVHRDKINGKIITTEKPLKPGLRGITLFANGRLVNAPEFFGRSESSHFYSYVTGWLDVDFLDDETEDVISTNRQSLNWEIPITSELKNRLQEILSHIQKDWRKKRKEKREEDVKEKTGVDIRSWYSKLPKSIQNRIGPIVETVVDKSELESEEQVKIIENLHVIIPEYPYYHWRNLHPKIRSVSLDYYQQKNYHTAFLESIKKYIFETKNKEGFSFVDCQLMEHVFGDSSLFSVTSKYKKPDGGDFEKVTKANIEDGQRHLSVGVVKGGRNPLSHEEIVNLRESGLFSEEDCLDLLSLLSHLFKRLDDAQKRQPSSRIKRQPCSKKK